MSQLKEYDEVVLVDEETKQQIVIKFPKLKKIYLVDIDRTLSKIDEYKSNFTKKISICKKKYYACEKIQNICNKYKNIIEYNKHFCDDYFYTIYNKYIPGSFNELFYYENIHKCKNFKMLKDQILLII